MTRRWTGSNARTTRYRRPGDQLFACQWSDRKQEAGVFTADEAAVRRAGRTGIEPAPCGFGVRWNTSAICRSAQYLAVMWFTIKAGVQSHPSIRGVETYATRSPGFAEDRQIRKIQNMSHCPVRRSSSAWGSRLGSNRKQSGTLSSPHLIYGCRSYMLSTDHQIYRSRSSAQATIVQRRIAT
jgi:hypothetical protein